MAKDSIDEQMQDSLPEPELSATPAVEAEMVPAVLSEDTPQPDQEGDSKLPVAPTEEQSRPTERREIVKSATLVSLGNFGSSLMGMVRQVAVNATGLAGPFSAALKPTQTFYDLLVNGSVSGALIPTFNEYADPERRYELRRLVYTLVNAIVLITLAVSIVFYFIAPWLVGSFLVGDFDAADKLVTLQYSRIIFFSLAALGPFSILLAGLYALKEFGWPAFATTSYHIGIILGAIVSAVLGTRFLGNLGLAFGVLVGAAGELLLIFPGIRNQKLYYLFILDLKQPALRRILRLYAPIALSFLVSMGTVFLDLYLQSRTPCVTSVMPSSDPGACGAANVGALALATTLVQFPIGLVAAALQVAVLPTLSTYARENNMERFKETLLLGFRLGLLLMIPAMAGLIVLQTPITQVLFAHGHAKNPALIALALQNYAYQLPFVALDQLLIAAFYARRNTIVPVVVGFVSVLGYLAIALPFYSTWGLGAMAFANTVQNSVHGIILLVLLRMAIGSIHFRRMIPTVAKIVLASALLIGVAWGVQFLLGQISFFSHGFLGWLLTLILAGGLGVAVFGGCVLVLKVEEVNLLKGAVMKKLGRA
ncbi:MAG TPA: lipid II flippase MurJ [Ktedonobacteraceae bacterium]|nr:lipid II flippase MurJ [Ktedonobacteraceae bacterium]